VKFQPGNAQHIGARQYQQDAFGFSDLTDEGFRRHAGLLAIVADGMGGLEHGDQASRAAIRGFLAAYREKRPEEPIPAALRRGVLAANSAVFDLSRQAGAPGDIGTTLVAAVLHEDALHWISVGDSPLILVRDGELTVVNAAHTYDQVLRRRVDVGEISRTQARRHPDREALTSYLGMAELGEFDSSVRPFPLRPGDYILLASDGLTKTLRAGEITAALGGSDVQGACEALVRAAISLELPDQDNVTVIALRAAADEETVLAPPSAPEGHRRRGWLWVAAAVLLVALSGLIWLWLRAEGGLATLPQGEPSGLPAELITPAGTEPPPPPGTPIDPAPRIEPDPNDPRRQESAAGGIR
jgi:protein phosphatase